MDNQRSLSGNGEDNVGIPDDLRCKRSDGKQWRCTAMSMPDKTVCEKHYIQAKKRAANSAMRASMKKGKRQSVGESDIYLESKSDDMDMPNADLTAEDYPVSVSGKKHKEKVTNKHVSYSPETPSVRSLSARNSMQNDDIQREYEENLRSYKTPPSVVESSRSRSRKSFDDSAATESSDGSSDSSDDTGGQMCHQCRRNNRDTVVWCLRCDRRGYCDSCISTWYSTIPLEEIEQACPACRGSCNCKVCIRADNLIKVKIREIPVQEKLEYLYCLLASVLPVVKRIHNEQCSEVEFERKLQGNEIDLGRSKLNADEQMCCDFCRTPIIDYHRHCMNCSYDICLSCCQDLREASENQISIEPIKSPKHKSNLSDKFSDWIVNSNNGIPCPPKEYGGCGFSLLTLKRIFKMNWVAKLVKNVDEMVNGCKIIDEDKFIDDSSLLYCPSSEEIGREGIREFRKHWIKGEPVIVKEVFDISSMSSWDPMAVWRGIRETTEEKVKDDNKIVKAMDCLDWHEVDIELGEFIKGYSEGRIHENGWPQMLKLKNWPSPSAFEEFLMYQRPEFINKLPLLEYIHSKWGLLNVAAKLPHYSLQNDAGPKIFISYGTYEELGRGDSVTNLHVNMRDMVYLLVHTIEVKPKGLEREKMENIQIPFEESEAEKSPRDPQTCMNEGDSAKLIIDDDVIEDQGSITTSTVLEEKNVNCEDLNLDSGETCEDLNRDTGDVFEKSLKGVIWDVFRREDVPKLLEYLRVHWDEFQKPDNLTDDSVNRPLYDGAVFLNTHHKGKLKQEFGIEPWCFDQHLGEAVFIPAGCPFQLRNLQSTAQLALDFLSPESLGEAVRLAYEIRSLPNEHDAKVQMMEVGKISLYAASSAIKEVQKLVLDPKLGAELGFEDPNLTAMVSDNLDKMSKRRDIACLN